MVDVNETVFLIKMHKNVSCQELGVELAAGLSQQQAAILLGMADDIATWQSGHSWPVQCRFIAEKLSDAQCLRVAGVLSALLDHLRAIPRERRSKQEGPPVELAETEAAGRDG